ncbi:gluconate 2-dehydrogenase subunit 3 family protein [Brevibacillus sp. TJ4]|uniref:gluconate 2-dehydrogenase subunit 3 family protein n=1 Tax=Brevibacillus sp. TJ4 TaxID=3234853 RepID=UPI003BA1C0D2
MSKYSRYPAYDVWQEHDKWDEHTRKIVGKRKSPKVAHRFFSPAQSLLVETIASLLVDDHRMEVLTYVTQHLDESLARPIGEAQRKVGLPPKQDLYRIGLAGVDAESKARFRTGFVALKRTEQLVIMDALANGDTMDVQAWGQLSPADFFKRMLHDTVNAYYSHPLVWSDIGYGGPAYPRGYVRVEKGLTDPWEAKADGK